MAETDAATRPLPFYYHHVPKNILLVLLSLITLPFSAVLVLRSFFEQWMWPTPKPDFVRSEDQKTILVTGVSMTKGLTIARILAQHTSHRIIGADTSTFSPGRFSNALTKFYKLAPPSKNDAERYIDSLIDVIRRDEVDLWISCSNVSAAVEDGEVAKLAGRLRGPGFQALQFDSEVVERLHSKDRFIDYVQHLGLAVPESWRCVSEDEVLKHLVQGQEKGRGGGKKRFILKPIGVDDRARENMMTLLPLRKDEDMRAYLKTLSISEANPFQVQRYVRGEEYCTHALIICGRVVAFTCCKSSELLMHYEALQESDPRFKQMLDFTQCVAGDGGESFSGHLSFDFLAGQENERAKLYAIECNPRAHTAVVMFQDTPQLVEAYLSAFLPASCISTVPVTPRDRTQPYYWFGHDLVALFILPLLDLLSGASTSIEFRKQAGDFWKHMGGSKDAVFSAWDPVPFFVLYHVYWPMVFLRSLYRGERWSRVNVSTTKVFEQ